jgi:serine/threonine protein kinase
MTLLHSALLTSPSNCYEISAKKFNRKKLAIYLQTLTDLYSPAFCSLLEDMLAVDPSQRCTIEEVQQVVHEYFINNSDCLASSKLTPKSRQNQSQERSKVHELSLLYSRETNQRPS